MFVISWTRKVPPELAVRLYPRETCPQYHYPIFIFSYAEVARKMDMWKGKKGMRGGKRRMYVV